MTTAVQVVAEHDGVRLAGSVWLPDAGPRGLLLMHPGSGPSDRDNDVLFPPLRAALLTTGVAVASFDKRGVGGSSGRWEDAGISAQAGDLLRSLSAARDVVPHGPVGLFGHSQGAWVVLEAAAATGAAYVVMNSGPSVSPLVQETYSTEQQLRAAGWSDADVAAGTATFGALMDLALTGATFAQAQAWCTDPVRVRTVDALVEVGIFVPQDAGLWRLAGELCAHDPGPALDALDVPLLALLGGEDRVVPVAASADGFRTRVRPDLLHLAIVDGGDHRFGDATGRFVPGYLPTLTRFVEQQLTT